MRAGGEIGFFRAYVAIRSHCACGTRERIVFMPFLCLVAKKWRKKRRPGVPPGAPLGIAALQGERRDLIKGRQGVLQIWLTRAAGGESKNVDISVGEGLAPPVC